MTGSESVLAMALSGHVALFSAPSGGSHTALVDPVDIPTWSDCGGWEVCASFPPSHQPGPVPSFSGPLGADSFASPGSWARLWFPWKPWAVTHLPHTFLPLFAVFDVEDRLLPLCFRGPAQGLTKP